MKRILMVAGVLLAVAGTGFAFQEDGSRRFSEVLSGLKEAPQIVSTTGNGTFIAEINR